MMRKLEKATMQLSTGRKELRDIVRTCDAVEDRKFNPFLLDVSRAVEILRKYLRHWRSFEDHCLDAKALNKLSRVIGLQDSQLRFQSSALYADPEFLEHRFKSLTIERLAKVFAGSWHPVVQLEQFTLKTAKDSLDYWNDLLPIEERWKRFEMRKTLLPTNIEIGDLVKLGIVAKEGFAAALEKIWNEMKRESKSMGMVDYWKFICRGAYPETVRRAYYVSFLVTYGYADLLRKGEEIHVAPNETQRALKNEKFTSFPIAITKDKLSQGLLSNE